MKTAIFSVLALGLSVGTAQATTYVYDFKEEANASGQIGEAIFSHFSTTGNGVYAGPELHVSATKNGQDAYVYFDNGNAGMGVCEAPNDASQVNVYQSGSGANRCLVGSDDGLTSVTEVLEFTAAEKQTRISAFYINSNHDDPSLLASTIWDIGGQQYDLDDFTWESISGTGDVRIDVDFLLNVGESVTLHGVQAPDSYIAGVAVAPVPLPAAGIMLLAGLGGLSAMRRGRKKA